MNYGGQRAKTGPRPKGKCSVCGMTVALTKYGFLRAHKATGRSPGTQVPHCDGSGRKASA